MNPDKLFIPLLLGTTRQGRESENVANWVFAKMTEHSEIETKFFDTRNFNVQDHYGPEMKDRYPEWRDSMVRADGLVIVTPEYNRGYPGTLKSVLDLLLQEYIHKVVACVSVSAGPWGGVRVVESLLPVVREMGFAVTFTDLNFPRVATKFDQDGDLLDPAYEQRAKEFFDELIWMCRTLKWGRQNLFSKYHQ